MIDFAPRLVAWQALHGRHDLPWQANRAPYRVWLSEIMLQQTQVATVIPYFERFILRFPDLASLAAADPDAVLALWSGLGYYSRARNLHKAARTLVCEWGGCFPDTAAAIATLPGIGRSTAAAIAAVAFGERTAILDGNVKRVLARHAGIAGWPGERAVETRLWQEAEARLPAASQIAAYTQATMDLGALVCTRSRPRCTECPVATDCVARLTARVDELPGKRPRKTLPDRETAMLLIVDASARILLEKRPAHGVWGGLYSLPEAPVDADPSGWCLARIGHVPHTLRRLPDRTQVFTHFRLTIQPHVLQLDVRAPLTMAEPARGDLAWFEREAALASGLPAPVRSLLEAELSLPACDQRGIKRAQR